MPVLDWSLPRKKNNLAKFYKIDVISMTEQDSFVMPIGEKSAHGGNLRKAKSLNDLLSDDNENKSSVSHKTDSPETISNPPSPQPDAAAVECSQTRCSEYWADQLTQRGDKKSTGKFIVSGFSTLSRRAGGGMEVPDINMQAIRVFLRNGTHKTVRTYPTTTCKEVLQSVLKKIGLQESTFLYGLYIQYAISDGRIAQDDECVANINPNTWDSVTRIYLCRREEFSSTATRSRCASFARDFLEIEQTRRSDSNFAYDIKEFTNIQKHIQLSTHRGRVETIAVHKSSVTKNMVTNKLIAESFADCWERANRQLGISNGIGYIESGVKFKTVKTPPSTSKRKLSASVGTINRSYTIERGKERRPALAKMFSTGSLETSNLPLKPSGISASPLLHNVNANSNNSNNNLLIPYRTESMINLYQHSSASKHNVCAFLRPLEHSSSLPVIKISKIDEEDDEIYSTPSVSSLSQSDKSELLHNLSPFSSYSSLDLQCTPRKEMTASDDDSYQIKSLAHHNCLLVASKSLPSLATNHCISTCSDVIITNKRHALEFGTKKLPAADQPFPIKKPVRASLSAPPPLPPRKHFPSAYDSSTLPNRLNVPKNSYKAAHLELDTSRTSHKQQNLKQYCDGEDSDSIGEMPSKHNSNTKLSRRRSISLSDLRSSLEKKSLKLTSMCNVETLKKATVMKIPGTKSRQLPQQKLIKQPADYHNVSVKELMAVRAAVTSPPLNSQSSRSSTITIRPKSPDDVLMRPTVPKRHSSLYMSSCSDEDIILQYKRMSSDSLYSCHNIEMVVDSKPVAVDLMENNCQSTCNTTATIMSGDDMLSDQKVTELDTVHPINFKQVHKMAYSESSCSDAFTYDHLSFNRSTTITTSNIAVNTGRQSELASQLVSPTDDHYKKTIHFSQKQETCSIPYNTLQNVQPVVRSQVDSKFRPMTAVNKKPSCSHIYEDIDTDYEDIDDGEDDEGYVVIEPAISIPLAPPLPPSFSKHVSGGHPPKHQQQVTNSNTTKTVAVSSFVDNSRKVTRQATVKPQIKIMVGKTVKTNQSLNFQDELNNEIKARNPHTHKQLESHNSRNDSSVIQGCQHTASNKNFSTAPKQPDGKDTEPSELEAKFLPMRSAHDIRKEMIKKTELKLATNNTTKQIELHNYNNMTKKFTVLKSLS